MTTTTKRPDVVCRECGRMFRDFAPEGDPVCQCGEKAVRAIKDEMMTRTKRPDLPPDWRQDQAETTRIKPRPDGGELNAEIVRLIDELRRDEGDSVTFISDNPDFNGQPNCAIVCNGDWTGYEDRRFAADTILDALSTAATERKLPTARRVIAESNGHHWVQRFDLVCCRDCGIVRRADDKNSPCKGIVTVELRSTPTNESPAPQAEASEHAPWSEDEEDAERLLACASRRKKYGDENCECDEDGSCVECEYDMQDVLKKRYAPLKHTTTPAPQPPVEGLREALLRDQWSILVEKNDRTSPGERMREALERIRQRADGFDARGMSIFSGDIMAEELRSTADEIEAALALQGPSGKTGGEG